MTGETGPRDLSPLQPCEVGAVIVAAGESRRMDGVDKMFAPLLGRPLISHTIDAFQNCASICRIVVVSAEGSLSLARKLAREVGWSKLVGICEGGDRRQDSVAKGLECLRDCQWVVIHDGARPCVTSELVERGLGEALDTGAAIAAVPVKDTIKVVGDMDIIRETPERSNLWAAQTPQIFRLDVIVGAYRQMRAEATDDAALVELAGYKVKVYMGSYDNIKITTPHDLALAEVILGKGSDAHRNRL